MDVRKNTRVTSSAETINEEKDERGFIGKRNNKVKKKTNIMIMWEQEAVPTNKTRATYQSHRHRHGHTRTWMSFGGRSHPNQIATRSRSPTNPPVLIVGANGSVTTFSRFYEQVFTEYLFARWHNSTCSKKNFFFFC